MSRIEKVNLFFDIQASVYYNLINITFQIASLRKFEENSLNLFIEMFGIAKREREKKRKIEIERA